jgi:hypothetical protein
MHEVKNAAKQHNFDVFTSLGRHKMEREKDSRNSILRSGLEYPTKVDEVVNKCNDDFHTEQTFIQRD